MKLRVAKWGSSLAVRLPVEYTRAAGLKDGDSVEASISAVGAITLLSGKPFNKPAFLARIARLQASMPMTAPVVEAMRQEARY